jgi:hypothetical protein
MVDGPSYVQVAADGSGKKIATQRVTVGSDEVERHEMIVAGTAAAEVCLPLSSAPAGTEYALPVRNIPSGTQTVDGTVILGAGTAEVGKLAAGTATVGNVGLVPTTTGGLSIYRLISAASDNAQCPKASPGQVYGWCLSNVNAQEMFVKLYNLDVAPTVGTSTPVVTLLVPGGATGLVTAASFPQGIAFSTGIALAITGLVADSDTTAVAADEVVVNLFYK